MPKITPHLWYDTEAKEAAELYTSVFKECFSANKSKTQIKNRSVIHNTPSGNVEIFTIDLLGQEFMLLSAGPYFKFTPAISFLVACEAKSEVNQLCAKLLPGGMALMELGEYPFSERYVWLKDKFGVSWQIMYMGDREIKQSITPTFMFVGSVCGKAEEAINFYTAIFHNTKIGHIMRYGKGQEPDKDGTIVHASFTLENQEFAAMDSAHEHKFTFNEAVSFIIYCTTQEEIDHYWNKLSAVPASEQCGWLKDKFGVSWQVVPMEMNEMMSKGTPEQITRVTEAFLKMKKFDIAKLKEAYVGK